MRLLLECGVPVCYVIRVAEIYHLKRIQRLISRLLTGICHLPYEEGIQRLALYSLRRRRRLADLITAARRFLRGHPYNVLQGETHRRLRRLAFSVRVVKYWNKLPASVLTVPFVLKRRLEKVWTKDFPHHLY